MLQLAPDYLAIEKRQQHPNAHRVYRSKHDAAITLGLSSSYFYAMTKKKRMLMLLGRGCPYEGYLKYQNICVTLYDGLIQMIDYLDASLWGHITFDHFMGLKTRATYQLTYSIIATETANRTYNGVITMHKLLKQFAAYMKLKNDPVGYLGFNSREPITRKFVIKYYWSGDMTTEQIAQALVVPNIWVQNEIKRLGMVKKENNIKPRGRRGWTAPPGYSEARRNQPHSRAVVQICPKTFSILRTFDATGAVERDGWSRENVRKAINSVGLHDGFLWSYLGNEHDIIAKAKAKGDLEKKLHIWENGQISIEDIEELYIKQDLTTHEVGKILKCHHNTVAQKAMKHGLSKKKEPLSEEKLRQLYIHKNLQAYQIATITGRTTKTIQTYLSRMKIYKYKKKEHCK